MMKKATPRSHLNGYLTMKAAEDAAKVLRGEGFRVGVSYDYSAAGDSWTVTVANKKEKQ